MMQGMASRAIDNRAVSHIFPIMDHDSPEINKGKKSNVSKFVEREQKGVKMIRNPLCISVQRMKSMTCKRGWHDPFMMRLMNILIDLWMVQSAMNPINQEIGEEHEERELSIVVPDAGTFGRGIVYLGVAVHFKCEDRGCHDGHNGKRFIGLDHFEPDLIF